MAHDTHHDTHDTHHDSHHTPADARPTTSYRASFWFVLILVGLFVAAVNFINVMGHDEGGHGADGHKTEHDASPTHDPREATSSQTLEGETGVGQPADETPADDHTYGEENVKEEGAH